MYFAALLLLALFAVPQPAAGQDPAPQPARSVIENAREIALETVRQMEATPRLRMRSVVPTARRGRLRQGNDAAVRATLRAAMSQPDSSYVTRSAAAYGLYLVDPSQVDTVVDVLVGQMNRMAFADLRLAELLLLSIGKPAIPRLLHYRNNPMVLALLGAMGADARSAVPALRDILGTHNMDVAVTLAAIGTPEAVSAAKPVLKAALGAPHVHDVRMALEALAALGTQARDAVPAIRSLLAHGDADTRLYAALALADVGDTDRAVRELGRLVVEDELHNRFPAIQKLGSLGARALPAVPQLLELVQDGYDHRYGERADAVVALGKIAPGNPAVRAALRASFKDAKLRPVLETRGVAIPPQ